MEEDPGADFYEFTAEDYHRVMAGYNRQRQVREQVFPQYFRVV